MLIKDLIEASGSSLYHLTDVTATIDMLKNKRFRLSKEDDTFYMSFARSVKSGFFTMMIGPDAVMLIVNGVELKLSLIHI